MKCIIIILDGFGGGAQYDAEKYGDEGCNTLANVCSWFEANRNGINLSNMADMGLGNIESLAGITARKNPAGFFGRMEEKSVGKDTTVGHWEMMGIITKEPFPTYPDGFPYELIERFKYINKLKGVLGNKAASGTEIIKELGEEHVRTGFPIVYTSADSVFQIAAHESVINIGALYQMCERTRSMLTYPHNLSRVIARPFIGEPGRFLRTERRKDFSIAPPSETVLDILKNSGLAVTAVGKTTDIFAGRGITETFHTKNNADGIERTFKVVRKMDRGLIFTNLVDFDMLYGHRNDTLGYGMALEEFDGCLPRLINEMKNGDMLIITGDHGCDPTFRGTDHTRETPPVLVSLKGVNHGKSIGTRKSFADIGETVLEYFGMSSQKTGTSFLKEILWKK